LEKNKSYVIFLILFLVVVFSGYLSLEDEYENSILSFKIPENWTVVDVTNLDTIAGLKPVGTSNTLIDVTITDVSPPELVDGYIKNFSEKDPDFLIMEKEAVTVDGSEGIKLVYRMGRKDVEDLNSSYYVSSLIAFSKNNNTYVISSVEVSNRDYQTLVEPAMNKVTRTIKIKEYFN